MALSTAQLTFIANSALDFFLNKGTAMQQSLQDRPLVGIMDKNATMFPGGKGDISVAVQGKYGAGGVDDSLTGYTADDAVAFFNPSNLDRLTYAWREHHIGLTLTHTELKHDGISVSDEMGSTSNHTGRDKTMLINMFENKLFDFGERYATSLNGLLWGDGTGDAKALHGLTHFLVANPLAGTVGGKNRATAANAYLRNRARTAAYATAAGGSTGPQGGGAVTVNATGGGALMQVLQKEALQLRKYGGKPDCFLAGSEFIDGYQREVRANGVYSQTGFKGSQDGAMGAVLFDGTPIVYDPTLDDMGYAKRGYWFDKRHVKLAKMADEWKRTHSPARPHDKFVMYRSITSTGQMVATQLNGALVIDIA